MPAAVRPEDIAFNRASVALARSQALIASWLPPRPAEETQSADQLQQEDEALFTPGSDSLGVGAEPPKEILDGSFKRNQLSSNDKLRQQLLGKNAAKGRAAPMNGANHAPTSHMPTKKPARPARQQDDSEDEGEGRAAMFRPKKQKKQPAVQEPEVVESVVNGKRVRGGEDAGSDDSEEEVEGKATPKPATAAASRDQDKPKRKPVSFLDEMLEERSKKKKKRRKNQAGATEQF